MRFAFLLLILLTQMLFLCNLFLNPVVRVSYEFSHRLNKVFIKDLVDISKNNSEIEFVDKPFCDVLLIDGYPKDIIHQKCVLVSWYDFAAIPEFIFSSLENPLVKAYFGNSILRERLCNIVGRCGSSYHGSLINKHAQFFREKAYVASQQALSKIKCVPWAFQRNLLGRDSLKKIDVNFDQKRLYDVHYVVSLSLKPINSPEMRKLYTYHRETALGIIQKMKDVNNYIVTAGARLPFNEYVESIKESKIVVSPWGWGEWCWRDFEAILLGAILIKPDTSFVEMVPDLYEGNKYYVACKSDFSDLEEKIYYVLEHYDEYKNMRIQARDFLLQYTQKDFLNHFIQNIKEVAGCG